MDGTDDIIIIRDTEKQEAMETSGNSDDVTVGTKDQVYGQDQRSAEGHQVSAAAFNSSLISMNLTCHNCNL